MVRYFTNEEEKMEFLQQSKINTNSVITVGSTSYDIKEKWLLMASGFFNIDSGNITTNINEQQDKLSLLKAGLFGYINEINAHEIKNAVYHRNVLYDELFLNSASFPNSIYNFAKLYNVPIQLARPASMNIILTIRKEDLLSMPSRRVISSDTVNADKSLRTFEIVLDRNQEFNIENFKFLLPYDVVINIRENMVMRNNEESINSSVTARYGNYNDLFDFSNIRDQNISVIKDIINGIEYYHFNIDIYQIERHETEINISDNDGSGRMMYDIDYDGQLAGFNVYYEYLGKKEPLELYFNNTFTPDSDKFAYFAYTSDSRITISFSNLNNSFRPAPNSKIIVELMTTRGAEGNFTYNSEIQLKLNSDNAFKDVPISIAPISASVDGVNKPDIVDEKQKIVNKILTRDSIIMDSDLDNYFNEMNQERNINNSFVNFIKRRNDILDRTYAAFLLLRDNERKVIPTTTAQKVSFPKELFTGNTDHGNSVDGYVIPENSIFTYDYEDKKYTYHPKGLNDNKVKEYKKDKNQLVFINPYLIKVDTDPFLLSNYYRIDLDKEFQLNYNFINSLTPFSLSMPKVSVVKTNNYPDDVESDTFRITIEINIDETGSDVIDNLVLRGILTSNDTNEKYGYFELNRKEIDDIDSNNTYFIYEGLISTNRKFKGNKISISDSLYDKDGNPIKDVFIDKNLNLHIAVLYRDSTIKYFNDKDEVNDEYLFMDNFPSHSDEYIGDYSLVLTSTTDENVILYDNMSDIMRSIVTRKSNSFDIEMIPLVSLDYFLSEHYHFHKLLENYQNLIRSSLPKLENNTNVDMKFYNTRGPSKNFFIDSKLVDDNVDNVYLSRTDILLDFNIYLYNRINDNTDESIRQFISDFVEESNNEGLVAISNLIRLLEDNFSVIKYLEFNGISGEYENSLSNKYQKIIDSSKDILNLSKQEVIEYVPEYINIKKEIVDNKIEIVDRDSIDNKGLLDLGKSYDYIININYINLNN